MCVRLAVNLFEDFGALNVLFIGAGEMAPPVLAHLAAKSPKRFTIANRSVERAELVDHLGLKRGDAQVRHPAEDDTSRLSYAIA